MKRIISVLLMTLLLTTSFVFAEGTAVVTSMKISNEESVRGFVVTIEGDVINLETDKGLVEIKDSNQVIMSDYPNVKTKDLLEVNVDSDAVVVSVIQFSPVMYGSVSPVVTNQEIDSINEKPQDNSEPVSYEEFKVSFNGEKIEGDVEAQVIDGIAMVPLRSTLEAMGYTVTWNANTFSVDIMKGAQWTSISIGENAYFRNKMAPTPLSAAPVIVNSRTLVPAEFFAEILGLGLTVESGNIQFNSFEAVILSGYISEIKYDETGMMTVIISTEEEADMNNSTIIRMSSLFTHMNKKVVVGEHIHVVVSMMMTASIPPQTSGYLVY